MAYNIVILPEAETNTLDSYIFYETKQSGLGERFINPVEESYKKFQTILNITLT